MLTHTDQGWHEINQFRIVSKDFGNDYISITIFKLITCRVFTDDYKEAFSNEKKIQIFSNTHSEVEAANTLT